MIYASRMPKAPPVDTSAFTNDGVIVVDRYMDSATVGLLRDEADRLLSQRPRAGLRRVLSRSAIIEEWSRSAPVVELASQLLGAGGRVVRSILFDKTPETNWDVSWHQDTTIAVRDRIDIDGFGPWSVKDGIPHVQPPADVLEGIVTLRFHLDSCPAGNGALLVVPGSHRRGVIPEREIDPSECDLRCRTCEVEEGGIVAMRPLILHASRKSTMPSHRRVVHLEFSAAVLVGGLEWTDA